MVRTYVVLQGSTHEMRRWSFGATLSNGLTYFLYGNGFDRGVISDAKVNGHRSNEHYYLWSVPVVRGKNLTIELEPWVNSYGVMNAEAKIQFVYFGANN